MGQKETLIHLKERVEEEYKQKLLQNYIEDYGEKYYDLIKQRQENTIYIFESQPDITYQFYNSNQDLITEEAFAQIELFYYDYRNCYEKLRKERDEVYFKSLCRTLKLDQSQYPFKEALLAFSDQCFKELVYKTPYEDKKLWATYEEECERLKINARQTHRKMRHLFYEGENLDYKLECKLVEQTLWGKAQREEINQQSSFPLTYSDIAVILFISASPDGNCLGFSNAWPNVFAVVPVLRNVLTGQDPIRTLFHESRHAIEYGAIGTCGLIEVNDKYRCINEIRTEKNATLDYKKIEKKEPTGNLFYSSLYPYTEELLDEYKNIFDEFAVTNDIAGLETLFGLDNLKNYEKALRHIISKDYFWNSAAGYQSMARDSEKTLKKKAMTANKKRPNGA